MRRKGHKGQKKLKVDVIGNSNHFLENKYDAKCKQCYNDRTSYKSLNRKRH